MVTATVKVMVPPSPGVPRGAAWAGAAGAALARVGRWMWRALERVGESRARREMSSLAERYAHDPEIADALRNAMHRAAKSGD